MTIALSCTAIILLVLLLLLYLKYKRLISSLLSRSVDEHLENDTFPKGTPQKAREIICHISHTIGQKYSYQMASKEIQYAVLQSQINPHFLYNTLEAIRSEALMSDNTSVAEMTERLSKFFRYSISAKGDVVTLQDELNNIKNYFFIQRFRFDDKYSLEIESHDVDLEYCLPKMTLQPLVENAVYHGLESRLSNGQIKICIIETDKKLIITVSDNGIGIPSHKLVEINNRLSTEGSGNILASAKRRSGIALCNVNNRLKLYFGNDYGIVLRSIEGNGTDVEVCIPKSHERDLKEVRQ